MSASEKLLTAEEYFRAPDPYEKSELVRGVVVPVDLPGMLHGYVCGQVAFALMSFLQEHDLGWAFMGVGIITERNPDTVRGCDVSFFSYDRIPQALLPDGYPDIAPNVAVEVTSFNENWMELNQRVLEFLNAGAEIVCVLDPETKQARLFYANRPTEILTGDEILPLPAPLDKLELSVSSCFGKA